MNITIKIGYNYFKNGMIFFKYEEYHAKNKKR